MENTLEHARALSDTSKIIAHTIRLNKLHISNSFNNVNGALVFVIKLIIYVMVVMVVKVKP